MKILGKLNPWISMKSNQISTPINFSKARGIKQKETWGFRYCPSMCGNCLQYCTKWFRVRRLRPHIASGLWLRKSLDNTFDPVHTWIRDQLRDEGTINVVPLPEVPSPTIEMLEGISNNMLNRLSKKWETMDSGQRSQALSELALPCLEKCNLSTPRLEELIWHRILVGGSERDIHSQIHTTEREWPIVEEEDKKYARRVLTSLISSGLLNV